MIKKEKDRLKKLLPGLLQIKDPVLREKVADVWITAFKNGNFRNIDGPSQWEPRKKEIRLSNIEHTNQVTQLAVVISQLFKRIHKTKINSDYLIAGALLHDVDKLMIFDSRTGNFSRLGKQFNHTFFCGHLALVAGLPAEVAHIAAAHSQNFSTVEPQTAEAIIVRQADYLVANLWNMKRNIRINYMTQK